MPPETHYARSGDVYIAYQVIGAGPVDVVMPPGTVSHLDRDWESPPRAGFYKGLSRFCRLIRFDKRGTGLSNRPLQVATLEERADDIRAAMDAAGDGFFATFDGPARAVRSALAIVAGSRQMGMQVRAGLHTGECKLMEEKVGGLAVHIGARVLAQAGPSEVWATSTVRELVVGSGLTFQARGARALKGVPGEWQLYTAEG